MQKAGELGDKGHVRLARWRETGGLLGVCAAAVAPTVLASFTGSPFAMFAAGFLGLALLAAYAMRREWSASGVAGPSGFREVLSDRIAIRLLLIALVNADPGRGHLDPVPVLCRKPSGRAGVGGAAVAAVLPCRRRCRPRSGARRPARTVRRHVLLAGMVLSIVSFAFAFTLGAGDTVAFALICLASGAALGADMTLLPAIFAGRMARIAPNAAQAFGLWSFVTKFTLAFAAVTLLPLLQASGFRSGPDNPAAALAMLSILYALVPCALKLVAIGLLIATPIEES